MHKAADEYTPRGKSVNGEQIILGKRMQISLVSSPEDLSHETFASFSKRSLCSHELFGRYQTALSEIQRKKCRVLSKMRPQPDA